MKFLDPHPQAPPPPAWTPPCKIGGGFKVAAVGRHIRYMHCLLVPRIFTRGSRCGAFPPPIKTYHGFVKVREGRRAADFSKSCVFPYLLTQPFLNIHRHAIYQTKAEYHGYLLLSMIVYNSSEVKLKIVKEIEN